LLIEAVERLREDGALAIEDLPVLPVERSRGEGHGDFASAGALALAKPARMKPRDIATLIVDALPASDDLERVEIAGPGFINFYLREGAFQSLVAEIREQGERYGRSTLGAGQRVQVEFVSANPTGPLHVGHGRGAAYGSAVANLLDAAGFEVQREYYVNDAGRQMDILALSVWLRYLEAHGEVAPFPVNAYRGAYVRDMAATLTERVGASLVRSVSAVVEGLPPDEPDGGDKELHVDALVARARGLLGAPAYDGVYDLAVQAQVADIREDLAAFGVGYDRWFSERSLVHDGAIDGAVARLRDSGHLYERDGALWFRSSELGDEKDRVVVRENGQPTYFASDIAYLDDKFRRGFEHVIYVWGADHHGYVPRMLAACEALGHRRDAIEVLLVQFANLYRGGEKVAMSTRSGEFVTLRELRDEVGTDAARFFYVVRRCEQHLDFDLDLAKSQSNDNPVYYLQYAHARICSVKRPAGVDPSLLREEHELALLKTLSRYPEVVEAAALAREPHQVAFYLREVANDLHTYYNAHTFLVQEAAVRDARLALVGAVGQVLHNGLELLGVGAPETM
jgi:arginyl-tRNA synthetase